MCDLPQEIDAELPDHESQNSSIKTAKIHYLYELTITSELVFATVSYYLFTL